MEEQNSCHKMLLTTLRLKCTPQYHLPLNPRKTEPLGGTCLLGKHMSSPAILKGLVWFPGPACPGLSGYTVPLGVSPGEAAATRAHCFPDALRKRALLSDSGIGNSFPLPLLTDATPGIFNGNLHTHTHTHVSLQGLGASQHALGCE